MKRTQLFAVLTLGWALTAPSESSAIGDGFTPSDDIGYLAHRVAEDAAYLCGVATAEFHYPSARERRTIDALIRLTHRAEAFAAHVARDAHFPLHAAPAFRDLQYAYHDARAYLPTLHGGHHVAEAEHRLDDAMAELTHFYEPRPVVVVLAPPTAAALAYEVQHEADELYRMARREGGTSRARDRIEDIADEAEDLTGRLARDPYDREGRHFKAFHDIEEAWDRAGKRIHYFSGRLQDRYRALGHTIHDLGAALHGRRPRPARRGATLQIEVTIPAGRGLGARIRTSPPPPARPAILVRTPAVRPRMAPPSRILGPPSKPRPATFPPGRGLGTRSGKKVNKSGRRPVWQ